MLSCKDVYGYPEMQGKPGLAFPGINPVPVWRYAIGCDDMPPTQAIVDQALAGDPNKKILSTMLRFFQECEKYSGQITELSGSLDSCNYYTMAGLHGEPKPPYAAQPKRGPAAFAGKGPGDGRDAGPTVL